MSDLPLPPAAVARYSAIKQAIIRDQCERSFEFFARYFFRVRKGSKFVLNDHHLHLIKLMEDMHSGEVTNAIVNMPPRYSKAIDCGTPMWTPDGWRSAGEIRHGDQLMGSNGQWTRVIGVHPQGVRPAFDVRFSDGSALVTCGEHRWSARLRDNSVKWTAPWQIKTTDELAADLTESDGRKKWRIPVLKDTNSIDADLPIEPYAFGCWLGDGHSHYAAITSMDSEIVAAFEAYDPKPHTHQSAGRATTYGLRGGFVTKLKALGVLKNKHIPDVYMRGSHAQRLALLQGLCDTDGWVGAANGQQGFSASNERLSEDFRTLVNSLGGVWRGFSSQPAKGKRSYKTFLAMPMGDVAFRLPRKLANIRPRGEVNTPRRFVAAVEPVAPREMVCFTVDAADHLFCAGRDLVVTHNTELCVVLFVAWCYAKNPACEFIHLSYSAPLATENSAAAREVIRSAEFQGLWPRELAAHKNGKGAWATKQGGSFYATSTGGQVTGFGAGRLDEWNGHVFNFAGMLLIDDPLKPDEARHDPYRKASNRKWTETLQSRRNSQRTPTLCIMQRIHEDDFTATLLADTPFTSERFRHVVMPAILDEGLPTERALWPAKHSLEQLRAMRDQKNARGEANPLAGETFSGQYQQRPTKAGGSIVRSGWWEHYFDRAEVLKVVTHVIITADTAYTEDTANDPSALHVWGFEGKKRMYLLDRAHGWWDFDELVKQLGLLAAKWPKAKRIYIEAKASGISLQQTFRKTTKRQVILWKPKDYHWPDDKVGRMMQWGRQVHGGVVLLPSMYADEPSYQPWVKSVVDEHAAFSADDTHAHDDDCDAANMAGSVWVRMGGGVRDALAVAEAPADSAPVE